MSELKEKKEAEILDAKKLAEDERAIKDDICPHCLSHVSTFPYMNHHPLYGWVECASCGIVFSPQSIRKLKIERATKAIHVPKLVVPV